VKLETTSTAEAVDCSYLTDLSPKDKPWDEHASERDRVRNAYLERGHRYATKITECSQWLDFALKSDQDGDQFFKLQNARFCRVRHCPVCQWRRSLKWRARFIQTLPKIQCDHSGAQYLFLTLTVKNCCLQDLHNTLASMNTAWKKLTKLKAFPAIGWVKSVEVTKSKNLSAHPHFHVLLMVPAGYFSPQGGYLSQSKWSSMWQKAMQLDYLPVIDIRKVQPKKSDDPHQGLRDAVCETLKYQVKPSDLMGDPDWLIELTNQLHKTRAVAVGGIFKEYLAGLGDEPDDLVNIKDGSEEIQEDLGRFIYHWQHKDKRYKIKE
jgi:plasmid rolling circle replication initiator protein Rep